MATNEVGPNMDSVTEVIAPSGLSTAYATSGASRAASTATPVETYNDTVVRQFAVMTVVWGIIGMAVGAFVAAELIWPGLSGGLLVISGMVLMAYNYWKTAEQARGAVLPVAVPLPA